jgi:hypothetical protein
MSLKRIAFDTVMGGKQWLKGNAQILHDLQEMTRGHLN